MNGTQIEQNYTSEHIREIVYQFQRSRIILTAFELDIFTILDGAWRTSDEVAAMINADKRAVNRLMNALVAIGFLKKTNDAFANTPSSEQLLVQGKPEYMISLKHSSHLWDSWSTLTEAVRKGTSITEHRIPERGNEWRTVFIGAMHERGKKQARETVSLLDLTNVERVLDLGGGSGVFSMAFALAKPGIKATVFDLPEVTPLSREYLARENMTEVIDVVGGDYIIDEIGRGFDLVFLSAIIHSNSPTVNRALIRKCAEALNSQGQIVVQDFIMEENRIEPAHGAMFSLNMLVGTKAGDTYTESEVRSWMEESGITHISRQETKIGVTQIIGRKT